MQLDSSINNKAVKMCGREFKLNAWTPDQDVVLGKLIAIDTETELIKDHHFPPLVLLQVTAGSRVDLVPYDLAEQYMLKLVRYNPGSKYVFVNAAFDLGVLACGDLYDMIDKGQVVDMMDRYKLFEIQDRGFVRKPASLANMAKNILDVQLSKDADVRLTFTRDKPPSAAQLEYGASDVVATWWLGCRMPEMPTEADSQIMGSVVLDAISRNGMLVDKEKFDEARSKFEREYAEDLEFLELHGYNPLLSRTTKEVMADGLEALGIDVLPNKSSGPVYEYILYRAIMAQHKPLEEFRKFVQASIAEADAEECGPLCQTQLIDIYVETIQSDFDGKLKRDRLEQAREHVKTVSDRTLDRFAATVRINPFKPKNRKLLDKLLRGLLDDRFEYNDGVHPPMQVTGLGLRDMARDDKLCMWPMAMVLRELCRAKAGVIPSIKEFDQKEFSQYIRNKAIWYGNFSTEWSECMSTTKFMQARLIGIESKNPEIKFPRTDKGKIQVSGKDKWIFKKFGIEDKLVERYISFKHNEKILSTYLNTEFIREDGRIHTRYENYVRTGRTSSSKPNVQNIPGSGGIRQTFIPPPMHVLASIDYSQLELCSLAQHCYKEYGYSRMRELINAKIDLHSWFAAKTSGLITDENDYDGTSESRERVIELLEEVKDQKIRKDAKAANFGFPGGMQEKTFLKTQRGYGNIDITLEECAELRLNWFKAFPEMNKHMEPTPDVVTPNDKRRFNNENIRLYRAHNIMGVVRRKCTFNSACNYPFQSLAALGAKRALWAVWRDGRYAKNMINFIHDEILFELPVETAAEDVRIIQEIMEDAMKEVIPDVRIEAEGCLMACWDKKAKPVFDMFGNLTVWYPEEKKDGAA